MVDVTLQVIGFEPTNTIEPAKEGSRWKLGQIQDIYRTLDTHAVLTDGKYNLRNGIPHKRFMYIHVTDVPAHNARRFKDMITETVTDGNENLVARSQWGVKTASMLLPAFQSALLVGEMTATWTQAKLHIAHFISGDLLTDADLS